MALIRRFHFMLTARRKQHKEKCLLGNPLLSTNTTAIVISDHSSLITIIINNNEYILRISIHTLKHVQWNVSNSRGSNVFWDSSEEWRKLDPVYETHQNPIFHEQEQLTIRTREIKTIDVNSFMKLSFDLEYWKLGRIMWKKSPKNQRN